MDGAAHRYPRSSARFSVSAQMPWPAKAASPCMMTGTICCFAVFADARLLGARAAHATGSTASRWLGFETRCICTYAVDRGESRSRPCDTSRRRRPACCADRHPRSRRISRRLPSHDVRHHVQAAAMAHAHHELFGAVPTAASGSRPAAESAGLAFQRKALGSEIARLQHLLEDFGLDQPRQMRSRSTGSGSASMRC